MALGQMMFLANKCSCLRRTGHMEIKFIKRLFLYRSPEVSIPHLLSADLCTILGQHSSSQNVIIGDFSINWAQESTRQSFYNLMIKEKNFRQLIFGFTTDNRTIIDHLKFLQVLSRATSAIKEFQQGKPLCNFHFASTNQILLFQSNINFLT